MLRIEKRATSKKSLFLKLFALLLLGGGIYGISLATYPVVKLSSINPNDNQTVRALAKEDKPTENRVYIPKIDVNVPFATGDQSVMEKGAWWRKPENGNPADGGNFILSAHRFIMGLTPQKTLSKSPFYNVGKLETGDQIIIDYNGERYVYEIEKKYTAKPTDIDIENKTEKPQLTLYSCTFGGSSDGRDVFIAHQVGKGDEIKLSQKQ